MTAIGTIDYFIFESSSRKLRPSQMEFKKEEPEDDPEDETVGGTAQELLS